MKFDILTIFPDMLRSVLCESVIGRAIEAGIIEICFHNIREYTKDRHRRTDAYPFGGGMGMVMTPQPVVDCHRAVTEGEKVHTVYMSPQGKVFDQKKAKELAEYDRIVIICGHYEGMDQRVIDSIVDEEISIGDYVLTGGEIPAAVVVDAVSRLKEGVLASSECYENESIASGILEYPQYTRPRNFEGMEVPDVLIGGNHAEIEKWRRHKALEKTLKVRPDLLNKTELSKDDLLYLETLNSSEE